MSSIIQESCNGYTIVPVETKLLTSGKLFFTGEVNEVSCNKTIQDLLFLSQDDSIEKIYIFFSSPGGDVQAGLCLYDTIRLVSDIKPVITVCIGLCASMGSILMLSADERLILPHGKIMVHGPSFGNHNIAGKKVGELAAELKDLQACSDVLEKLISERTDKSLKEIKKICATDTYYSASESLDFGLTTKIISSITEVM